MPIATRVFRNLGNRNGGSLGGNPEWRSHLENLGGQDTGQEFTLRAIRSQIDAGESRSLRVMPHTNVLSDGVAAGTLTFTRPILLTADTAIAALGTGGPGPSISALPNGTGAIAIIAYNTGQSDGSGNPATVDALRFVALDALAAGTVIYFTDRTWNGTSFAAGGSDGVATYTVGAGGLAAGQTVNLTGAALGTLNPEEAADTIYAYRGTTADAPTQFLFAIEIGDGNTTFGGSLVNTGLVNGVTAVAVGLDSASYQGPTTEAFAHLFNGESLLENIADFANWEGDNRSGGGVNALDHPDHNGPYYLAPDISLWSAASGGGDAITVTHGDSTVANGFNLNQLYTLDNEDLADTLVVPKDIVFDTARGLFFIADSNLSGGTNRILQGNISDLLGNPGTAPPLTVLYTSNQAPGTEAQIFNLEVDPNNGIVYFTHGMRFEKILYNTAGQTSTVLANFGTASGNPVGQTNNFMDDFVINFATGTVYLTSHRVQSAQDGDNITRNFLYRITGLDAADGTNAFTFGNGAITVMNFSPDDDDTNNGGLDIPGEAFPRERGSLEGLALSADGNTLYFATASVLFDHDGDGGFSGPGGFGTPPQLQMGGIYSYALTGNAAGAYTLIYQQVAGTGPQGLLDDLEVDPVTGQIYFLDLTGLQVSPTSNPPGDEGIWRINANGSGLTFFQTISNINALTAGSLYLNRAPTVTSSTQATPTTTEVAGVNSGFSNLVQPFTALDVTDADSNDQTNQLGGAVVRISSGFQSGATHQDRLTINGTTSGVLDFGNQDITYTYNSATGVMVLTGASTFNNYESAIALVRFSVSGDNPTNYGFNTTRGISWTVSDGLDHSDEVSTTITITAANDVPVNTVGAAGAATEDGSAFALTGISVFDVDADPASQNMVVTLSVAQGAITILTNVAGGITAGQITAGANGSATMTITATQNQINATLAAASGLTYAPTGNYNGADALTVVTSDAGNTGTGGALSDTDVKVINIAPVNDAPTVIDATQTAATILEDTPSAGGETVSSLFTASFSDALDQQQTGGNPSGSVANTLAGIAVVGGSTSASGSWQYFNGVSFVNIGAASTASAVLINAGTPIRFLPALNFNGSPPDLIVHLVDSSGGALTNGVIVNLTGATGGTTRYSSTTVALSESVTAVNDAPVNTVGGTLTVAEDSGATNVTGMSISDVDANPATDVVTVTLDVLHGTLNVSIVVPGGVTAAAGNGTATVILTGTINQINATLAAAGGLTYTPTGNYNGGDRVQITTDDGGATGLDPGATGTATSEADIDSKTINVTAVNDPVTGTAPPTLAANEDATNVAVTGLSISDVDATLNPSGVFEVTLSATNGTLTLATLAGLTFTGGSDGTADATMTFHGTLAAINTALATASYTPTANYNGSATITLGVTDTFGGIVATGTGAATSDSDVIAVTVNAVNDPIGTTAPPTLTLAEDATNVAVTGMSISDIDSTLNPSGVYQVTLSSTNGTLTLTTTTGLTFDIGDGAADVTMTFHGTLAAINTALATANYTPTGNYNGSATITLSATDTFGGIVATGTGAATSDSDVIAVTVTAVNDTPVVAVQPSVASIEQVAGTIDAAATISDVELGALNNYAGSALTVARNGGAQAQDLLTFGASGAFTVSGANLQSGGLTFATFTGGNGTALVITFTSTGTPATQALVNAVVQSLQYTYTGDTPPASIVMNYSFNDGAPGAGQGAGGSPIGTDAITINITDTAENAPPVVDLNSGTPGVNDTNLFVEGTPGSGLGTAITVTDPDGDMIQGATITITDASAGDLLTANQPFPGGITIDPASTATTLILIGAASAADYATALGQLGYTNTGDDPTVGGANPDRVITVTVRDALGTSAPATMTMTVAGVNDEPILTATGLTPTFTEGNGFFPLFAGAVASTVESGQTFTSLTLTVTNVTDGANELLAINGTAVALTNGNSVTTSGGLALMVTVSVVGSTATVTFAGAALSAAQLQTLVEGISYSNSSENPTDADRVVTITQLVDSGSNVGANDNTAALNISATVNVNPVNDTPITTVPGTQTINEDASVTLSTGNGNAIQVSDVDATTLTVTLTVAHGTLTLASIAGLNFGAGDGTADTTMTFTGTAAAINAALGSGLTYNPNANFNGIDSIAVFTTDNGQSGGPEQTDTDTIAVNITAINDAPVVIGDGTEDAAPGLTEDNPGPGQTIDSLFAGQYSDAADNQIPNGGASSPGQFSGIAVTANGSSAATGQWQYFSGGVWTDIGAVSDGAAKLLGDPFVTLIRFNPAADFNGTAPTLTVHLIDNSLPFGIVNGMVVNLSGPGATGGTTAYSTGTVVLSQNVLPVNDAPLNTVPGAQMINEDASFTLSTGNGNAIQVADVDATTLTVTLTVVHGTLTLASSAGLSFGTGDGTADATMTFTGTAAAINAALGSGLTYNPTANYNGPDSIAVLTTDSGQTGMGGTQQDNDSIAITVNSVNDAPSGANNTLTGSEDDPLVLTAADFGFTDPVDGDAFLAVIIDTFPANGTLYLDVDGPGGNPPVNLSTLGPGVFVSVVDINAGHLYFQPDADEFGNGYAQFTFRVQDDGGMLNGGIDRDPVANTIFINITPDNLPPAVDLDGATGGVNYATTYVEDGAGVAIGSGVSVTDPNSGTGDLIESATITLTDRVAGDSLTLTGALPAGITSSTAGNAGSITITITGPGTGAQYQALIQSILYASTNQDPTVGGTDPARTVTVTVNDGLVDSAVATTTIAITAVNDAPVAQPDAFTITESGTIVAANLFANNGSGADSDPDGPPLAISAVNGSAGNVNTTILLASGASLTVNANGTFSYNPNNAFLPTPTAGSGASNTPGHDSFTYTLAGGNTVTVSINLTGLDTNDTLYGTGGADILAGGNGNDTYIVENSNDQVIEAINQGFDVVYTLVNYELAAGSHVETLSGADHRLTTPLVLTGNGFNNNIYGNLGNNILNGGGGADIMLGFGGNDIFYVDNAGDLVDEEAGNGFDVIYTLVDFTLAANCFVETLSAADHRLTTPLILTGNGQDNSVYGNIGDNILNGGGGADIMVGFAGNDIFFVDNAGDFVAEDVGGGSDIVYATVSYTLGAGAQVETLSVTDHLALTAINLTGNEISNNVYGNAGANILNGGAGADLLYGFNGADTFAFTTALGGGNSDLIADFEHDEDKIALDDAIFTTLGLGALDPNAFVAGTAALDANDRIIYDANTGALYYDADGNGAGAQILFAVLFEGPSLTANDFIVI